MTGHADAVVFVIQAGATSRRNVTRAIDLIGRQKIPGIVLNRVRPEPGEEGYYHYGHYYATESSPAGGAEAAERRAP